MVIIVTGTIAPENKVDQLFLRDEKERLDQYMDSLYKTIECRPATKIVFCDNSGFGTEEFVDIKDRADALGVEFEALSFKGDSGGVIRFGKGYGEGEIMKYVIANSKLIKGEEYMIKKTGRLFVANISKIARMINQKRIYFNIPNIHRKDL